MHNFDDKLSVGLCNIQGGLTSLTKTLEIQELLHREKFDLLGINETNLKSDICTNTLNLPPNYNLIRCDRPNDSGRGGCGILISENIEYKLITISGINRKLNFKFMLEILKVMINVIFGFFSVLIFFIKQKPNLVISTGGYSSFLPLQVARILKVPYVLHEQNSYPGIVTRMFSKKAKAVMISIWDGEQKSSLKINLWTKEMMAEEMKFFTFQIIDSLADNYKKSVGDEMILGVMRDGDLVHLTLTLAERPDHQ